MKILLKLRIDVAHNYQNLCRSIKMMLRNDIDALRSNGLQNFLFGPVLRKKCNFSGKKLRLFKKNQEFSFRAETVAGQQQSACFIGWIKLRDQLIYRYTVVPD